MFVVLNWEKYCFMCYRRTSFSKPNFQFLFFRQLSEYHFVFFNVLNNLYPVTLAIAYEMIVIVRQIPDTR